MTDRTTDLLTALREALDAGDGGMEGERLNAWAISEIERMQKWLRYIECNFRDGRDCAFEALRGDAPPGESSS